MKLAISEIAKNIQAKITGDPSFIIKGVSSFEDAGRFDITFACDSKYLNNLAQTKAGAVIVPDSFSTDEDRIEDPLEGQILLRSSSPKLSFFKVVSLFHPPKKIKPRIHPGTQIGHNVTLGKDVTIEPNVMIGDHVQIGDNVHLMPGVYIGDEVLIGDNTLVKPNVAIMEKTRIGNNVIIHPGTVIGSDGFGFAPEFDTHQKIIHTGYVWIKNDVEIGAANTIDRGTLGMTVIGNGVKTDNLVHVAHNVKIGDNTLIVAQVAIGGSANVGKNVIIAGKAAVKGHIKIGDGAIIGPLSGVHSDVPENEIVSGMPQMPHSRWRKVVSIVSRLPEMRKKLFSVEKRLKALENKKSQME